MASYVDDDVVYHLDLLAPGELSRSGEHEGEEQFCLELVTTCTNVVLMCVKNFRHIKYHRHPS